MFSLILAIIATTQDCSEHLIKRVSATGRVVVFEDNTAWLTHDRNASQVSLWLQGDQVQLCGKQLINLLTREKATVYYITTISESQTDIEPVRKQKEEQKPKEKPEKKKLKKQKQKRKLVVEEE